MNVVILVGRLTRDPEIKTGNSTVAKFNIAVNRDFKDASGNYGADFVNCVAFGKTAEFLQNHFHKGSMIGITGRINTGSFTNKDGQTIYTTDVAVEKVKFVGSKSDNAAAPAAAESATPQKAVKKEKADKPKKQDNTEFLAIPDTIDDIPFVDNN